MLSAVNPLPRSVDLRIGLYSGHNRAGGHIHITSPLNNALQRGPDIPLSFPEQPKSVGVAVNAGAVCQPEILRNCGRALPGNESGFYLLPFRVRTNSAVAPMAANADCFVCGSHCPDFRSISARRELKI